MKKQIIFLAAITLSSGIFAGNIHESNGGVTMKGDMNSMHSKMKSMHNSMEKEVTQSGVLKNEDMQRLHKRMTLDGMSEGGMEARLDMMGEKGRAYHRALEQQQKNTAR
ncbi:MULTISPECIES: hypothetical protein [unclassified Marinobacter]|uniref:hypothetical protein n=1 Tax=unclassified Marinobacter TaxID=83889 RepID=UPI0019082F14|nr:MULTISPECIES: hypothetical protein [unclassified Marinobacter]MBK1851897.1 hypothetical protein [Marinobacter sp. 1-4A]MCK0164178.1 hypothetical protein [Marinobacter sp. S6332]